MEDLKYIIQQLKTFKNRKHSQESFDKIIEKIDKLRKKFVDENNQNQAKMMWFYEQILKIQRFYLNAYFFMKVKEFYKAWCELERCERSIKYLTDHFKLDRKGDPFSIYFIKKQVKKFQSIYPPYVFQSLAYEIKKTICNICGQENLLRHHCGHHLGEIYDGKRCVRYIKDCELKHSAIVKEPKWKYRVLFDTDEKTGEKIDNYDYSQVSYLIEILPSPFVEWDYRISKVLYPHSLFSEFEDTDECPCGSGEIYRNCCLKNEGILRDHIEFFGFDPLYTPRIKFLESQFKPKRITESKRKPKKFTGIITTEDTFFID
jgi:hypothetical protein